MLWTPANKCCLHGTSSGNSRIRNPGRRMGQITRLKPVQVEEYKEFHAREWPEVAKQLQICKIEDYNIFYDAATSLAFVFFRYIGYDFAGDMKRLAESSSIVQWRSMTDKWQEGVTKEAGQAETDQTQADDEACLIPGFGGEWKSVHENLFMR